MNTTGALPIPTINFPTTTDLNEWLQAQSLPEEVEHPIWKPSGAGRGARFRGATDPTCTRQSLKGAYGYRRVL